MNNPSIAPISEVTNKSFRPEKLYERKEFLLSNHRSAKNFHLSKNFVKIAQNEP